MCIFSLANVAVSGTNIFARMVAPGRQALAYEMAVTTASEVAMVLPLPVVPGSGDDALAFIDLSASPLMFHALARAFIEHFPRKREPSGLAVLGLEVHQVGAFVASYVPSPRDFTRLDPRFRVPAVVFEAVPAYLDYGFAVFQLAPNKTVGHPMAFTFQTRAPERLFFPTVHVHDGAFHETARFDHALYYQTPACTRAAGSRFRGGQVAWRKVHDRYGGVVDPGSSVIRRKLKNDQPNADVWIAA